MNKNRNFQFVLFLAFVFSLAGVLVAQTSPEKILVVNGKTAGAAVREMDGHTYVEVEALARAANGAVTMEPGRVVLTFPVTITTAPARATAAAPQPPAPPPGLSVEFRLAAIAELAEMREWRGAVGAMITYGLAASDATAINYHDRCDDGLNQAMVTVSTEADRNAMQLLRNEFTNMTAWANQILAERKALNGSRTVSANALQNDRALTSIASCGRFLNTMIVSGTFSDDSTCH